MEYYLDDEKVKTDYFDTGTLFEMMLLEPQTVDDKVVTAPEVNRRTKAGREEYDNFLKENEGKFVVSQEVLETSLDMYERAIHDPEVKEWLPRLGHYQETKIYTHPATGLKAISKIDCRTELDIADPAIVDVKTMGKVASPQQWERDMYNLEYWLQAGAYCYAYQRTHFVFPDFYWMVFESKPPYGINIIKADPAIIDEGIRVWDNILKGIKFCMDEDLWHHSHKFWRLMAPYDTVRMPNYHRIRI